jgi:hypothetical protein
MGTSSLRTRHRSRAHSSPCIPTLKSAEYQHSHARRLLEMGAAISSTRWLVALRFLTTSALTLAIPKSPSSPRVRHLESQRPFLSRSGGPPHPIAMNPQGSSAYWIAAKPLTGPNAIPQYQLLEIDLGTGAIRHTVDMGRAYPGAIAVAPSGDVYVAITYAKEAGRTSSAPQLQGRWWRHLPQSSS